MAWSSTVPGAIEGLLAAFGRHPDLAGVDVRDGPGIGSQAATEVLSVGYAGADEELDVEGEIGSEGLAAAPDRERYSIRCVVAVLNGSGDVAAARRRAYELLAFAGAAIAQDRTLGGVVLRAGLGAVSLSQTQDSKGVTAAVLFGVDVDAYTMR